MSLAKMSAVQFNLEEADISEWFIYIIISNAITSLLMLTSVIVRAKYSRDLILNKLTLKPLLVTMVYCCISLLISLMTILNERRKDKDNILLTVECLSISLKTFFLCLAIEIHVIEWRSLTELVILQADPKNRG